MRVLRHLHWEVAGAQLLTCVTLVNLRFHYMFYLKLIEPGFWGRLLLYLLTQPIFPQTVQVCSHSLWLRQLPQNHMWQGGLWDGVLLPLQAAVASEPDVRCGAPGEGPEPATAEPALLFPQLQSGEWGYWYVSPGMGEARR